MPAQKPIVCLVTPINENAKSVRALKVLIQDLQENKIDWQPFPANGDNHQLDPQAKNARDYVVNHPGVPAVIVAAGTLAASLVQNYTDTIPIVLAAGGSKPSNNKANMTGFYLNAPSPAKTICQEQYDLLNTSINAPAAVLYDSTNDPGGTILSSLTNYAAAKTLNVVDIAGNLGNLTVAALQTPNPGNQPSTSFMLIPNALFYDNCDSIATVVEQANLQNAIYPEREYKNAHSNKNGKRVHGHKVALTFGLAAYYVDSLLNDPNCIGSLPWQEALRDDA
jgi:ABC-type uncharacterized transport system substrate-binding protein